MEKLVTVNSKIEAEMMIGMLESNGALAVQVPMYHKMPVSRAIKTVSLKVKIF